VMWGEYFFVEALDEVPARECAGRLNRGYQPFRVSGVRSNQGAFFAGG